MVNRFYGTLYVSNSEMHRDKDWVRASDYDAAEARIRELEAERDKLEADIMEIHPRMVTAEARIRDLEAALREIAAIEDEMVGGDWDEIERARTIARSALASQSDRGSK